jgi:predicted nucleic acid-binding Zn finger protein
VTITIDADDPRSIKALQIAAGAAQWLKVRTVDGEVAFGIPSQCAGKAGRYYVVTAEQCDCEDFKREGLRRGRIGEAGFHGPCKHVRAVQLHDELVRAQQIQPRRHRLLVVPTAGDYSRIASKFFGED